MIPHAKRFGNHQLYYIYIYSQPVGLIILNARWLWNANVLQNKERKSQKVIIHLNIVKSWSITASHRPQLSFCFTTENIRNRVGLVHTVEIFDRNKLLYTANEGPVKFNINVWFSFMYSQKWNCEASLFPKHNYNDLFPNSYIRISVRDLHIFPGSVCIFFAAKYVDISWEHLNRLQTH